MVCSRRVDCVYNFIYTCSKVFSSNCIQFCHAHFFASIFALLPPLIGSSIAGWDATELLDLTPFVLGVVYPLIYAAFIAVDVQREGTLQILFAPLFVVIIFEVVVAYFMYLALRVVKSRIADS